MKYRGDRQKEMKIANQQEGKTPPFQICTALLAYSPKGSLLWNENMQREQTIKSQDSRMNQS